MEKKEIEIKKGNGKIRLNQRFFDYMDTELMKRKTSFKDDKYDVLPFCLEYIGYLEYEMKGETEGEYAHESHLPDALFQFVDRAYILDHQKKILYVLFYEDDDPSILKSITKRLLSMRSTRTKAFPRGDIQNLYLEQNKDAYMTQIKACQDLISQGKSYRSVLPIVYTLKDPLIPNHIIRS